MICVNIDITEKKSLQAQVLRSQRLESVGRLAGGIAHDLNNILGPMLLGPQMLRDMLTDPEGFELLSMIESSAQRAASIIRQLLTFSRGTEGALAPFDCNTVVEDMLHIIRETFPRNIQASRSGVSEPMPVLGNPTQLHQVLMNLCVNARDEMPEGGKLELRLERAQVDADMARKQLGVEPGRFVVCSVIDDGRGIAAENIDKLFDPFFTTKSIGQGTGLGLATALGIVRAHGGFIEVHSELGRGARFDVFLPAIVPSVLSAAGLAVQAETGVGERGQGELLLLVDDEDPIRRVTRAMLEKHGYRVLLAESGQEALEVFRARRSEIHLVLTDLMMPTMDGNALIEAIRAEDSGARIIIMSGNLAAGGQKPELAQGVLAVIEKPFTAEALLRCLHTALQELH
jgi:nitrogen-specific signal transduction histidine kinase/CheY-like chemotaxis protein